MKGVKVAEFANATSKRFQSDHILAGKIQMPDGIEVLESIKKLVIDNQKLTTAMKKLIEDNKTLTDDVATLNTKIEQLNVKVDSFETEVEA